MRSMFTSSFNCSTVLRASAILAMLLDMAAAGKGLLQAGGSGSKQERVPGQGVAGTGKKQVSGGTGKQEREAAG